jgi:putative holliday junction resolvase
VVVYLAMDYGKKRIGLAYCDKNEQFVFGLSTLNHTPRDVSNTLLALKDVITEKKIEAIILGLPLNMDGSQGFMVDAVKHFAEHLTIEFPHLPLHYMDERLTSKIAKRQLMEAGVSTRRQKGKVDEGAARQILEDFLKRKQYTNNSIPPETFNGDLLT